MPQAIRALLPSPDSFVGLDHRARSSPANDPAPKTASGHATHGQRFLVIEGNPDSSHDRPRPKAFDFEADPRASGASELAIGRFEAPPFSNKDAASAQSPNNFDSGAFAGLGIGDPSRNASPFLASLITQSRLGQGLELSRHEAASVAYRVAGAKPAMPDNHWRLLSVTA